MSSTIWTAEDDALVKAGREAGESCADIAKRLPGRSEASVRSRSNRLKHQPEKALGRGWAASGPTAVVAWTAADDALVKAGREAGDSLSIDRCPGSVHSSFRKLIRC